MILGTRKFSSNQGISQIHRLVPFVNIHWAPTVWRALSRLWGSGCTQEAGHSFSWDLESLRRDKQIYKIITDRDNCHKGNKERLCSRGWEHSLVMGSRPGLLKEVVFTLVPSNKKEWAIQKNPEDFYLRNIGESWRGNFKADSAGHSES